MKKRIVYLLDQYSAKSNTPAEEEELMAYFDGGEDETFLDTLKEWLSEREAGYRMPLPAANAAFQAILTGGAGVLANEPAKEKPIRKLPVWAWAAAAAIIFVCIGGYLWRAADKKEVTKIGKTIDVPPGKQGAILTLADGSSVLLDSTGSGVVAIQQGTQLKLQHGQLSYHPAVPDGREEPMVYNTITTPKGRQFSVTLPDGTQVWLNAASSLRYPAAFKGVVRQVEMTGEAYFEVAANARMPFRVTAGKKATVEVLGTHFNINAYDNEQTVAATLLEGRIKVGGVLLRPGQQAEVGQETRVRENVDLDKVIAWKNGLFEFDGVSLAEVMDQIERWYDVEVVYENGIPDIQFGGEVSRDLNLEALLRTLGKAGVHYRMEDNRKLVIMK